MFPTYTELPYVAFLSAALVLVPLPWHWRARNIATLSMIFWLFISNVIYGVDAIIWHHSVRIRALVWCDITSRLIIGAGMALPAACMCISIHLAQVASISKVNTTSSEKRRRRIIELLMCFGVPCLWMALHFTVQGHRFDIIENFGCRPNTYISIPSILLIWTPPLIFAAVTFVFSGIALAHFLRHRIAFARHLDNSGSGITASRYLRLMAMALVEIVVTAVASAFTLWFTTLSLRPWTDWADVHWDFGRVDQYPALLTPPLVLRYYYATWYIVPASALVFFAFFAFGQDAVREYRACARWVLVRACCRRRRGAGAGKNAKREFVSLPSASTIGGSTIIHTLPSYQTAVGDDEPVTPTEKDEKKQPVVVVQSAPAPQRPSGLMPIPIHHIVGFTGSTDDVASYYASSISDSPRSTTSPSPLPPHSLDQHRPTHPAGHNVV